MANLVALKAELLAGHPDTGAYNVDDALAAAELNAVNRDRLLTLLSGDLAFSVTDAAEFGGLTDHKQLLWFAFCGREEIDPFGSANVAFVQFIFGGGSGTVAALNALRTVANGQSRAQELFGGRVSVGVVTAARALP